MGNILVVIVISIVFGYVLGSHIDKVNKDNND